MQVSSPAQKRRNKNSPNLKCIKPNQNDGEFTWPLQGLERWPPTKETKRSRIESPGFLMCFVFFLLHPFIFLFHELCDYVASVWFFFIYQLLMHVASDCCYLTNLSSDPDSQSKEFQTHVGCEASVQILENIHPQSLTARPWRWWLEDKPASFWVLVAFQGRTVKLRGLYRAIYFPPWIFLMGFLKGRCP